MERLTERITFAVQAPTVDPAPDDAGTARTVTGLVVPFNVPVARWWGEGVFTQEGTRLPDQLDTVKLLAEHDPGEPVGYATDATYSDAGLTMTFTVPADHDRAAGYLADLDANLRDGFSVGIELDADVENSIMSALFGGGDDGPVVMAGVIREVSGVSVPAFNDARAERNRAAAIARFSASHIQRFTTQPREAPVMESDTLEAPPALPTTEELAARVGEYLAAHAQASTSGHPLAAYSSYDEYAQAVWEGRAERFALVDQVTTDNPGVVPPAWLSDVVGILDWGRPAVTAFGGARALPDGGMELDWPVFSGDLTAIVAKQAAEKTEVHSTKVSFTKGSAPLATYAGASDISYQLLRRSSPSYRELYGQVLQGAYAATTDDAFCDALLAAATPVVGDLADADALRAWLFSASAMIQAATGKPANAVVVATDVFGDWGALPGLFPAGYGTQNVAGTADASSLRVNVSGLEVTCDPYLPAGSAIAGNDLAAQWFEDGPFVVEQDDVAKLGRDVGIWGLGAARVAKPGGLIKLSAAAGAE